MHACAAPGAVVDLHRLLTSAWLSEREPDFERGPEDGLTVGDVGRLLRRRWLVILLPTVAAFGLSVAFVQVVTPRYTAETKLLLESRDSALTRLQQIRQGRFLPETWPSWK